MRIVCAALVAVLPLAQAAAAPPPVGSDDWNAMAPFKAWVTTQHDQLGRWCCEIGDGRPVEATIAPTPKLNTPACLGPFPAPNCGVDIGAGEHWIVHVTPQHWPGEKDRWMTVPDEKVTRNANPTGVPILWLYKGRVQCFAAPDGT